MNDDYIPLERYKNIAEGWFGVGNAVLETPDCPTDFNSRIEKGEVIHVPSRSAFYRKRPWTCGMR